MKALVYVRISHDPEGKRSGVERQRKDCVSLVEERGWTAIGVLEDNDRSAYQGKQRPGWNEVIDRIGTGGVDVLVAWASDRLTRQPRELEDLVDLLEKTETHVVTVTSGEYDLSTPEGRATARIVGAIARQESERKAERLRAANRHSALKGERMGGRRAFGYDEDGYTIREHEAVELREMARWLIDGRSARSLRVDLNERGIDTSSGKPWTNSSVTQVLRNPRYVGRRTYKGEIVADAEWPPIFDEQTWRRLQATLNRPERRWRGGPLKRWLTRVAVCGRCQQPLVAGYVSRTRGPAYTCTTERGCSRLTMKAAWLEDYVEGLIVDVLSAPSALERFAAPDVDEEELARIIDGLDDIALRVEEADRDYDDGHLDRARWLTRIERLRFKDATLEAQRDKLLRSSTVSTLPDGDVQTWWSHLDPEQRRRVARLLFSEVVVNPSRRLGGKPDWERIQVRWAA
jgi:DNA invertase Pin-like site-specific DNA recombinase